MWASACPTSARALSSLTATQSLLSVTNEAERCPSLLTWCELPAAVSGCRGKRHCWASACPTSARALSSLTAAAVCRQTST